MILQANWRPTGVARRAWLLETEVSKGEGLSHGSRAATFIDYFDWPSRSAGGRGSA